VDIAREYYVSLTLDRTRGTPIVIASAEGGVEIETVAREHPEAIIKEPVHPHLGLAAFAGVEGGAANRVCGQAGVGGGAAAGESGEVLHGQ